MGSGSLRCSRAGPVCSVRAAPPTGCGCYGRSSSRIGLIGCAAWYGMLCAATASMRRGYGAILGFAWPVALVVALVARIDLSGSQIGQIIHAIFVPLAWIDPFTYLHVKTAVMVNGSPAGSAAANFGFDIMMLAILTVVYLALAVLQWRRVEA